MARITITLPRDLHDRVRRIAVARGVSVAALVREAIEEQVAQHPAKPRSIGIGAPGHTDTARRIGDERTPPRPKPRTVAAWGSGRADLSARSGEERSEPRSWR